MSVASATTIGRDHINEDQQDLVLSLPQDITVGLLSSWLTLPDIVHLDSAMCNRRKRGSLLSLLSSREVAFDGMTLDDLNAMYDRISEISARNGYLNWLCERGVKVLEFNLMGVSNEAVLLMAYLEMNGPSVVRLRFGSCVGTVRARRRIPSGIEDALQHIPNCESVAFCGFNLEDVLIDDLKTIARGISVLCKLKELVFCGNAIGDECARAIAGSLSSLSLLTSLDLSGNYLKGKGARAIAGSLPSLPLLTSLGLSGNSIGDEGARAITGSLPSLPLLTRLDFGNNSIGVEGARAIAGSLPSLPLLKSLDFSWNSTGVEGARAIAGSLPSHPLLTSLNFGMNSIGVEGARAIAGESAIFTPAHES